MSLTGNATPSYILRGKVSKLDTLRGYSAYEVAVLAGFSGTKEEWLASLKGEQGDPGDASSLNVENGNGSGSMQQKGCTATGENSFAEGMWTTASAWTAHAEGEYTTASASAAHAEGLQTTATAKASHAEGETTVAKGVASHAEGKFTYTSGLASHAEGLGTQAHSRAQHVQGMNNIIDADGVYAHIVGNGADDTASKKSNAHTIDWDGNAWFAGEAYVGSHSGTNRDEGSERLARISDISNVSTEIEELRGDIFKIGADIEKASGDVSKVKNISFIVADVSGDVVSVSDSSDTKLEGLKLFGKTTQDGTPTPDSPVPLVSVGDGGSITVKIGVSTEDTATQSITANTPNGLPGIPVTSGGNYTDANGQQWVCDEVDFARGKYVHRVGGGKLTDITSWFFDHEIDGGYLMFKGTIPGTWYRNIEGYKYERTNGLYTHGRYREYYSPRYSQVYMAGASIYVVVGRENASDADAFKAWIDAQSAAGNTPEVMVALDPDRIAETDLTAEEIAAFKALHSNKPNTTVYNDGGAGMEMTYIADTKNYIDNKFAELQNAILSAGANV